MSDTNLHPDDAQPESVPLDNTAEHPASQFGAGPAYSLGGLLLMLVAIAGLFGLLRFVSMPEIEKWFLFAVLVLFVAGWWVMSVGSAQRRHQAALCSAAAEDTLANRRAKQEFENRLEKFAGDQHCSVEGAHFLADAIYFSPNYFLEQEPDESGKRVLNGDQLLVAVVRYAKECFQDEAEQRMNDWGFASREKLLHVIREMAGQDLATLGTRGFVLDTKAPRPGI